MRITGMLAMLIACVVLFTGCTGDEKKEKPSQPDKNQKPAPSNGSGTK